MSLIFSIIRITHSTLQRRLTFAVAMCYVLFWATTMGLQAWYSTQISSKKIPPDCILPRFIIIIEVTSTSVNNYLAK